MIQIFKNTLVAGMVILGAGSAFAQAQKVPATIPGSNNNPGTVYVPAPAPTQYPNTTVPAPVNSTRREQIRQRMAQIRQQQAQLRQEEQALRNEARQIDQANGVATTNNNAYAQGKHDNGKHKGWAKNGKSQAARDRDDD